MVGDGARRSRNDSRVGVKDEEEGRLDDEGDGGEGDAWGGRKEPGRRSTRG
jgi:hypothetical protein